MTNMDLNRRKFLGYLGTGAAALAAASAGLGTLAGTANAAAATEKKFGFKKTKKAQGFFTPIKPDTSDKLILPKGFSYDVVAAYGDKINPKGDLFGYNCDFTIYFPINGSSERGLLWVNHEYVNDKYLIDVPASVRGSHPAGKTTNQLYHQGGSIIEVYKDANGTWKMDPASKYARRHSGLYPFELVGPAAGSASVNGATTVQGTFANCSGGKTLWNTVLSCEENFEKQANLAGLDETHYGWVIEVDPFDAQDRFKPRKHTALGRFNHENAAMGLTKDERIVVYMGDDRKDACVYKFISEGKFDPASERENTRLLEKGTLYVANFKDGKWIALTLDAVKAKINDPKFTVPPTLKMEDWTVDAIRALFKTEADVLVHTPIAAIVLGGTPTDRPEDLEISPFDNTIFVAHTNNDLHGNIHGHITRIFEDNDDLGSLTFNFEIFAAGGRQSGFSAPDNLTFDGNGNLWTVTDMSGMHKGALTPFGNNGLFVIPTSGDHAGEAFQFASGPVECELTGPWFTPNEETLFIAVQHPGGMWPHRPGDTMPRPSVVAIKGFKF